MNLKLSTFLVVEQLFVCSREINLRIIRIEQKSIRQSSFAGVFQQSKLAIKRFLKNKQLTINICMPTVKS